MISSTSACSLGPMGRRIAIALVFLSSSAVKTGYALDWKSPTQFVGIGTTGTYDDVQTPLDHLEMEVLCITGTEKATLSLGELLAGQMAWRTALKNIAVDFTYNSDLAGGDCPLQRKPETTAGFASRLCLRGTRRD